MQDDQKCMLTFSIKQFLKFQELLMELLQPTLGLTFFFVIPREIGGVIVQIDELTGFNDILRFKFHFLNY